MVGVIDSRKQRPDHFLNAVDLVDFDLKTMEVYTFIVFRQVDLLKAQFLRLCDALLDTVNRPDLTGKSNLAGKGQLLVNGYVKI